MRKINAKFKEGVEAGLTGRPMEIVIEIDNEQVWDQLAVKAAAVKVQAKTRKKQVGWSWEEVNGKTVKVSEIMARTVTAPLTPETAAPVLKAQLSTMAPADKVVYLVQCGLMNVDGAQAALDHLFEKEEITEEEHLAACDELTEMD